MKVIAVFAVVLCAAFFLSGSAAVPVADAIAEYELVQVEPLDLEDTVAVEEPQAHSRQKRATCDLLSGTGISHSACAAHCLLKNFKGGYCNNMAVCVCRH